MTAITLYHLKGRTGGGQIEPLHTHLHIMTSSSLSSPVCRWQTNDHGDLSRRRRRRKRRCDRLPPPWMMAVLLLICLSSSAVVINTTVSAFVMNAMSYKSSASHRLVLLQASRSALQDLTVKELRQRVKDLDTSERGTLSRLKRKQDLIDYLVKQQQHQQQWNGDSSTANGQDSKAAAVQPQRRRRPPPVVTQMPSLDDNASISTPKINGAVLPLTLKEAAFERVYQRYPVLRQAAAESPDETNKDSNKNEGNNNSDNTTNDNNSDPYVHDDMRQWQHPIFTGPHNVTTDMDVVFVGTASCTPGVTRGVSCTALRLHWRRQTAVWNAQLGRLERPGNGSEGGGTTFQGGTWLFDVGECTQVRCFC